MDRAQASQACGRGFKSHPARYQKNFTTFCSQKSHLAPNNVSISKIIGGSIVLLLPRKNRSRSRMVRSPGFEPGSSAREAEVLTKLDYDRTNNPDIIR